MNFHGKSQSMLRDLNSNTKTLPDNSIRHSNIYWGCKPDFDQIDFEIKK